MSNPTPPPLAVVESVVPAATHVHHHYHPLKSRGVAALLEVLPGLFFQTFGIGHIYAGNIGTGLLLMFGYWALLLLNIALAFVFIGFLTGPLCWLLMMIISPLTAANSCSSR